MMIQQLLKTVKDNNNQDQAKKATRQETAKRNNGKERFSAFSQQNNWKTPAQQHAITKQGSVPETPAFNQNFSEGIMNIEEVAEVADYEQSQKLSQVVSVNEMADEECHPMILSNILNPGKESNVDKLSLLKMRNAISQLKQTQFDLCEYVEDQKRFMEEFRDRLAFQFQEYFSRALQNIGKGELKDKGQQDTTGLKMKLKSAEVNYQKACNQIEELKFSLQKMKNKGSGVLQSKVNGSQNNSSLEQRVMALTQQLAQSEKEMERLLVENEGLQQYIFDIEQKIVGVDLEVEKKFKEKMRTFPQYYNKSPTAKLLPKVNQDEVKELKQQIGSLQQKCMLYEEKLLQSGELENRLAKIQEKEKDLMKREELLKKAQVASQQQKQVNYQREHEILEAEENLSKKIADLRQKQAELSSWETELIRKANQTRTPPLNLNNLQKEDMGYRLNSHDDLHHSRQISLRSFGRNQQNPVEQHDEVKISPRRNYTQQEIQTFDPKRQLQKIQGGGRYQSRGLKTLESRRHIDSGYASRGVLNQQPQRGRNYKLIASSYYNQSREPSPYRTLNQQRSRGHYGMTQNHPSGHFRDTSKNSRSSAVKSIGKGYGIQPSSVRPRGEVQQMTGISSKLQRLRQQLKKQIDSIK